MRQFRKIFLLLLENLSFFIFIRLAQLWWHKIAYQILTNIAHFTVGLRKIAVLYSSTITHAPISQIKRKCLSELNFEFLPHPPYSPDMASTDFHLFRSLQHFLADKIFNDIEEVKNWLNNFLCHYLKIFITTACITKTALEEDFFIKWPVYHGLKPSHFYNICVFIWMLF